MMKEKVPSLLRNKKGVALVWAIAFGMVIFLIISVFITLILVANSHVNTTQTAFNRQNDIDQIGEYYIRCISLGGDFPSGSETDMSKYSWMDNDVKTFFMRVNSAYDFTYLVETETITGSLSTMYETTGYKRSLTVKQGTGENEQQVLHVVVNEQIKYNANIDLLWGLITLGKNPVSHYTVEEWSSETNHIFNGSTLEEGSPLSQFVKKVIGVLGNVVVELSGGNTEFDVRFLPNGGNLVGANASVHHTSGDMFTLPSATREGYRFDGWKDSLRSEIYQNGATYTAQRAVDFTAQWTAYKVTFNTDGGSASLSTVSGVVDKVPSPGTKKNKQFMGWYIKDSSGNILEKDKAVGTKYIPTQDVTFVAHWEDAASIYITYHDEGGNQIGDKVRKFADDAAVSLTLGNSNPTKSNDVNTTGKYTVTYYNGSTKLKSVDVAIKKTTPYNLVGWATTKGGAKEYSIGQSYSGDKSIDLYPVFELDTTKTKTVAADAEKYVLTGEAGKTFAKWKDSSGKDLSDNSGIIKGTNITGNISAYVVWKLNTCTVKFNCTNCSIDSQKVPYGSSIIYKDRKITIQAPDGYTMKGEVGTRGIKTIELQNDTNTCKLNSCNVPTSSTTIKADVTYNVVYKQYRTLTIKTDGGATITYGGAKRKNGYTAKVEVGATVSFTPNDSAGNKYVYIYQGENIGNKTDVSSFTMPDADTTIYLKYKPQYTLTIETTNGAKVEINGTSYSNGNKPKYYEGTQISFTPKDDDGIAAVYIDGKTTTDYSLTMTSDRKIKVEGESSSDNCLAKGTQITLADGTKKAIENITKEDKVLAFNHESGKYEATDVFVIVASEESLFEEYVLNFENGKALKIINAHGLFDYTTMQYEVINKANLEKFVGHEFVTYDSITGENTVTKLIDYEIIKETTQKYAIISYRNINAVANDMLTICDEIDGLYNFFKYDADLKYNEEDKTEKIAKYGISSYDEWSEYFTYEQYKGFLLDYTNIAFGENLATKEQHIKTFLKYYDCVVI